MPDEGQAIHRSELDPNSTRVKQEKGKSLASKISQPFKDLNKHLKRIKIPFV